MFVTLTLGTTFLFRNESKNSQQFYLPNGENQEIFQTEFSFQDFFFFIIKFKIMNKITVLPNRLFY